MPDIPRLAAELINDVPANQGSHQIGADGLPFGDVGDLDAVATFGSWEAIAAEHGEEIQPDDYQSLAGYLAKIARQQIPTPPGVGDAG